MAESRQSPERRDTRRRFEQWARNPTCQANTFSAVHGVKMSDVAKADGVESTIGQSPFAMARGMTFERVLFRNAAEVLREALVEAGVLKDQTGGFADFRLRMSGGKLRDLDEAIDGTARLLRDLAAGKGRVALIAGATVRLPRLIMLPETILVADVVAVTNDEKMPALVVGEIKTYPDRGGYTDGGELAQARAQAGVYVHGLRSALNELGLSKSLEVSNRGFLVLSRPGVNRPNVRAGEDLRFQAWRAERGFKQLEEAAKGLPPPGSKDPVAAIRAADTDYRQECISFCDRASYCFAQAVKKESPVVLGDDVARFLGNVSLKRATELIQGSTPNDSVETDLARRMGVA